MKCPHCGKEMRHVKFDVGYDILICSQNCPHCWFNATEKRHLEKKLEELSHESSKDVKVVSIGEGLDIRFPKELVNKFRIKKGSHIKVKLGKNGIELLL